MSEEANPTVAAAAAAGAAAAAVTDQEMSNNPTLAKMVAPRKESFPATKDNIPAAGSFVDYPRDEDVVGTRRRTWQHHPGNIYYRDVVMRYRDILMDPRDARTLRQLSGEIIDCIAERHGVFLKADEERGGWHVMDFAASLHKATLALKNAEIKKRSGGGGEGGGGPKKKKTKVSKKKEDQQVSTFAPDAIVSAAASSAGGGADYRSAAPAHKQHDLPPINYQEGEPPITTSMPRVFEAMEGSVSIDQYTKDIIALMCSQTSAKQAACVLDFPLVEDESDKQRLLRLQLRQRYIAALTIGMSPINFSVRLMEVWGGTVVERRLVSDGTTTISPVKRSDGFTSPNDSNRDDGGDATKQASDQESCEEDAAKKVPSSNGAANASKPEATKAAQSKPEESKSVDNKLEERKTEASKPEERKMEGTTADKASAPPSSSSLQAASSDPGPSGGKFTVVQGDAAVSSKATTEAHP